MIECVRHNYTQALHAWNRLSGDEKQTLQKLTAELVTIKMEIEHKAVALGYAQSCKASIAVCRGECCRHHFPKTFTVADFLAAIGSLAPADLDGLSQWMQRNEYQKKQCVLLTPDGCFLPFKSRPMVCTNAYPCFAGREYWEFKEAGNRRAAPIFKELENFILLHNPPVSGYPL